VSPSRRKAELGEPTQPKRIVIAVRTHEKFSYKLLIAQLKGAATSNYNFCYQPRHSFFTKLITFIKIFKCQQTVEVSSALFSSAHFYVKLPEIVNYEKKFMLNI
jgi:hypothetical protein